jgi:NADPH2:quinone reductase
LEKTRAIRVSSFGGPEQMRFEDVELPPPGRGQVALTHKAIGLNMVDIYYRSGLYPIELPSGLGGEAAGTVIAAGEGVRDLRVGDRVAYAAPPPLDAYSRQRVIDARWLVKLPEEISDKTAAAMMLKGLTSWYLLRRSYAVAPGEWVLLYAASGGAGSIIAQWAAALGARVIGIVGSERKRALAEANGCEYVLLATDNVVSRVREITGGKGVPVVYDSIGRDTFIQSLDCLRPHGVMVSFGNASGPVEPVSLFELTKRGSLYLTRPTLFDFISERRDLERAARELFEMVVNRRVRIRINQEFPLEQAAAAHESLESRQTTACTILLP